MKAIHLIDDDVGAGSYDLDLDGAFNDGFKSAANSAGPAFARWLAILWSAAAWAVGTILMGRAIVVGLPNVWADLPRWMF
jgi:hypothetical protein